MTRRTAANGEPDQIRGGPSATARAFLLSLLVFLAHVGCNARVDRASDGGEGKGRKLVFTAAGDFGLGEEARATLRLMGRTGADLHLALGDLSYGGPGSEPVWCGLVRSHVGEAPFYIVTGNHEDDYGEDGHIMNFARCLPGPVGVGGRYPTEYFWDYAGLARFILISPDLTVDDRHYYYGDGNRNYRWLAAAVAGARDSGLPWVIVGMHKNCLSVGVNYCNVYQDLFSLLVELKVDLVLHAHDHVYQRSHQLATSPGCRQVAVDAYSRRCVTDDGEDGHYAQGAGAVFVTVGTAGADLYEVNPDDPEAGYMARWMGANAEPRNGFLRVALSERELAAEFVGSTTTSSFRDAFRIVAAESKGHRPASPRASGAARRPAP
ncbi:MAG: metallophosphoesterase [Thermoanaerobaculia bacterium]